MNDFALARENMVESQVRPNGVTDHRIIDAMSRIARETYVPDSRRSIAYIDEDVEITPGRYLIEPMAFAKMLQEAEILPTDRVLLVGAGTGYGAAVLAGLAAKVVALEVDSALAALARQNLAGLACVEVVEGPLDQGWKAAAPYNVIIVEGRIGEVPQQLIEQLATNGRLVAVMGDSDVSRAMIWTRHGEAVMVRAVFDASIAALPGFARKVPAFAF